MTTFAQISITSASSLGALRGDYCPCKKRPISCFSLSRPKFAPLHQSSGFSLRLTPLPAEKRSFFEAGRGKDVILEGGGRLKKRRAVLVRFNSPAGFGFNGGGGGKDDGTTARVVGNLVLAIGLTYLTMTDQLGWVLDAIVSIWLLAVIIPIVGLVAFFWWAGRDIVQSTCPNCGNEFQIFKSSLNNELQLCPFCSQPISVVDGKFVKEPVKFSNEFTSKAKADNGFAPRPRKGKESSRAVVDVEAEVIDVD